MSFESQVTAAFGSNPPNPDDWGKGSNELRRKLDALSDFLDGIKKSKKEPDCPDLDWSEDCGQGLIRNCHSGEDTDCQVECGPCYEPSEESVGLF